MKLKHNSRKVQPGRNVWDGGWSELQPSTRRFRHFRSLWYGRKRRRAGKIRPGRGTTDMIRKKI